MRKNGFTLVEMLTVIIILVIISLLAIFSITATVKSSAEKLYKVQIDSIIDASRTYAIKNNSILADSTEITICDLKRSSLLDNDLKNPKTEEPFDNDLIIKIIRDRDGEFKFQFDGIKKMENYNCDLDVSVSLKGNSPLYVSLGSIYVEQGINVKRKDLNCTYGHGTASNTACYYDYVKSGSYSSALNGNKYNKVGTFEESYNVTSDSFTTSITRTIIVQDKSAPAISVNYKGTVYNNPFTARIIESDSPATFSCIAVDDYDGNVACNILKNDYNNTKNPGTYEIIYKASDKNNNVATFTVNVTVLPKNKNLIVGLNVDNVNWTNQSVNFKIYPLYDKNGCSKYNYDFGNGIWVENDTSEILRNGTYNVGIKCENGNVEDYLTYRVTNIDKDPPVFSQSEIGINVQPKVSGKKVIINTTNNIKYYIANDTVVLSDSTGAYDSGTGVAGYNIYINDEINSINEISAEGVYEIKINAYDYASNQSDPILAGYVVITKSIPTCTFSNSTTNAIFNNNGDVTYNNGIYKLTNNNYPITISYRFSCSYEYFENADVLTRPKLKKLANFYLREQSGINGQYNLVELGSWVLEGAPVCENSKCVKTYNNMITLRINGLDDIAYLNLEKNSFCDDLDNCNNRKVQSQALAKAN